MPVACQTVDVLAVGSLRISSTPSGAEIWVALQPGVPIDQGVTTIPGGRLISNLQTGTYNIRLTLTGYDDWIGIATVSEGVETPVAATLTPSTGNVNISSTPPGAEIFIDDIDQGVVTTSGGTVRSGLSPGLHNVKLILIGYNIWEANPTIVSGQTVYVYASLSPAACPSGLKYSGDDVTLQATPKDGTGPYYVVFRKDGVDISPSRLGGQENPITSAENIQITRIYTLNDADIVSASTGTIDFSVYIEDQCPTGSRFCEDHCIINIGCLAPVCNFTVT